MTKENINPEEGKTITRQEIEAAFNRLEKERRERRMEGFLHSLANANENKVTE